MKNDVQYHEYKVNTMGVKGINTRLPPAELLLMLLNPMFREMNFKHLGDLLKETINKLRENKIQSTEILTKIEFAHGLIDILKKYVEKETPSKKAYDFLKEYLFTVCPPNKRFVIGAISENLYTTVVNKDYMEQFLEETKTNCHSGFYTVKDAVKFWRNPNSVTQIDDSIPLIRNAIVRIFNFSKNSSSIERSFGGIKNNTDPNRPRLGAENMFKQHFLRELRRQKEVLQLYCSHEDQKSTMVEAITLEQRKKILQKQLAKIDEEIEKYDNQEEELNYQKFRE